VLLIAEAREASALATPPGVDAFTLPALRKDGNGQAHSRYLDLPLGEVVALRAQAIQSVLEAFAPDVLIVDHLPRGAQRELEPALEALRRRGGTRCVLGLRDVLGEPETVRREWERSGNVEAIRAHYDAIWIYGDPAVYDLVHEYALPLDVALKARYTGYLDHRARLQLAERNGADPVPALGLPPEHRLMLCLVGGGQDGGPLAEAFVQAELPPGTSGIVVTGPFMPPADRRRVYTLADGRPNVRVLEFLSEPALLMRRADRIVAMGGYNTVWEMLSFGKRALIVPRMRPGLEQVIRAERLRALGAVDLLTPDAATPEALSAWLARDAAAPPAMRARIDLAGLARLPRFLDDVLLGRSDATRGVRDVMARRA
jgi:predicted glycosyltransferase